MDKQVQCPCGESVVVPFVGGQYEIAGVRCEFCGRIASGGNSKTGEVSHWLTAGQVRAANAEYQAQMFSADMNEWYGRGNHPF